MKILLIVISLLSITTCFSQSASKPLDTCFIGTNNTQYTFPSYANTSIHVSIFQDGFSLECERGIFWSCDQTVGLFTFASPIEATEKVCITVK